MHAAETCERDGDGTEDDLTIDEREGVAAGVAEAALDLWFHESILATVRRWCKEWRKESWRAVLYRRDKHRNEEFSSISMSTVWSAACCTASRTSESTVASAMRHTLCRVVLDGVASQSAYTAFQQRT